MKPAADTTLARAARDAARAARQVLFFSAFINLLALTAPLYMLQIYDRVLVSRSGPTLLWLTVFAAACLATLGALELVRSRMLVRVGVCLDAQLAGPVVRGALAGRHAPGLQRDLAQLRNFASSPPLLTLFDAPWIPFYLALIYLLHPALGHVALAGALALLVLGVANERATRQTLSDAEVALRAGARVADGAARNAEAANAMGMVDGRLLGGRRRHELGVGLQARASDRSGSYAALARALRLFLQVAILGVGAWLVVRQQTTAGVIIAASIVMGRGLAPLEASIGAWRSFVGAREAWARLQAALAESGESAAVLQLPAPRGDLAFEHVSAAPPGTRRLTIRDLQFRLEPGTCLGITGPSAAGKSTLARLAVGLWRPAVGSVRLDGVELASWRREEVGPHIGYLPQGIELFEGTVAQNIARFGVADSEAVVAAAQLAGAHEMILALAEGYDTPLGVDGEGLSGGQRQRIGLARSFYRLPALIVLDEPSSQLDAEGEAAVRQALETLRALGRTVLVVAHRPAVLGGTDRMLVLVKGQIVSYGPTAEIMPAITRRTVARNDGQGRIAEGESRD